ncbi:MAG: hypothetical protein LBD87_05320, partial [Prevotellaceae bacterium]|nr:hypothetical protein [Prevotellaceae bacterium]
MDLQIDKFTDLTQLLTLSRQSVNFFYLCILKLGNMITITFPDGKTRQYEAGVTGFDIAKSISPQLA